MNGTPLTPAHGFPLRAIVPGWYGMAAIKWLQRIVVTERPFQGYYQTVDYGFWAKDGDGVSLVPITEMQVKASIARPGINEVIAAGTSYRVTGAAWTADAEIVQVELSTDGGKSWRTASLGKEKARNCWQLWECEWETPRVPGQCILSGAGDRFPRPRPTPGARSRPRNLRDQSLSADRSGNSLGEVEMRPIDFDPLAAGETVVKE